MDFGLFCDSCNQNFDTQEKIPLIIHCGQTICKECAVHSQKEKVCRICKQQQEIEDVSQLRVNQKLFMVLSHKVSNGGQLIEEQNKQQQNQQRPNTAQRPKYSFQQSNLNAQNNHKTQNEENNKANFQYSQRISSPSTTNYSSSKITSAYNAGQGPSSDTQETEKLAFTEVHHMSVIQEEGDRIKSETGFYSSMADAKSPINTIQPATLLSNSSKLDMVQQQHHLQQTSNFGQKQSCKIHFEKPIEYFCSQCIQAVCSKCMFLHHNGHDLAQIEDALKNVKSKIEAFNEKVLAAFKENEETQAILDKNRVQIEQVMTQQKQIVDKKFRELQAKLEERKFTLTKDLLHKYESALFKLQEKQNSLKEFIIEMSNSKQYYEKLKLRLQEEQFLRQEVSKEQIEMLEQVPQLDKFIYENTLKIKSYQLTQRNTKLEYQEGTQVGLSAPIDVLLNNAITLIQSLQFDNLPSYSFPPSQSQSFIKPAQKEVTQIQAQASRPPLNILTPAKKNLVINNSSGSSVQQQNTESSFSYPKNINNINNGINIVSTSYQIPFLNGFNNNRSLSVQNSQEIDLQPSSVSTPQQPTFPLHFQQEPSPISIINSKKISQQQQHNQSQQYSSKFAKLKFSRKQSEVSQELMLQLDTPQSTGGQSANQQVQSTQNAKDEVKLKEMTAEDIQESEEEIQASKIRLLDNAIYCVGDTRYFLMFDYKNSLWQQIYFDKKESDYQGTLKFTSVCQINLKKREFIMTGGCNKITNEASSQCFKFSIPTMRVFREVQRMKQARYGHAIVYVNQLVLVLGGFNHRDDEAQAPNTLNTCEKYSVKENEWTSIAQMQQERAYFSACKIKEEFVYVFGGFQNYETINSIEYYNMMLDKWTGISISMPIKIAKYGLAKLDENQIVISGGLLIDNSSTRSLGESASYSCVNTVYKFDCLSLKWTKLAKLNFRRSIYSTMAVKENFQIFAIGGTVEGINEVYDYRKKKWNTCQSYTNLMGQNDLQTYAICSLSKNNEE